MPTSSHRTRSPRKTGPSTQDRTIRVWPSSPTTGSTQVMHTPIPQAIDCPAHGAPLVVLGAPLVIDANEFKTSSNDLHTVLREISTEIRKTPLKRWTAAGTRIPQEGT